MIFEYQSLRGKDWVPSEDPDFPAFVGKGGFAIDEPETLTEDFVALADTGTDPDGWSYATAFSRLKEKRPKGRSQRCRTDKVRRRRWVPSDMVDTVMAETAEYFECSAGADSGNDFSESLLSPASPDIPASCPGSDEQLQPSVVGRSCSIGSTCSMISENAGASELGSPHGSYDGPGDSSSAQKTSQSDYFFGKVSLQVRNKLVRRRSLRERQLLPGEVLCGSVTVEVKNLKVNREKLRKPYLLFRVEGTEKLCLEPPCGDETGDSEVLHFDLTDIQTDLVIHMFDDLALSRESPQGRIIVPLAPLVCERAHGFGLPLKSAWRSLSGTGVMCSKSLTRAFLPPTDQTKRKDVLEKFHPVIMGAPGTGMLPEDLPQAFVEFHVTVILTVPLWRQLLLSPWMDRAATETRVADPAKDKDPFSDINPVVLQERVTRFLRQITTPAVLLVAWHSKASMTISLALWSVICMYNPGTWSIPLVVFFIMCAHGAAQQYHRGSRWSLAGPPPGTLGLEESERCAPSFALWEDQVGEREVFSQTTQLLQLQAGVLDLQEGLGEGATALERISNTLSWADPPVSLVAYTLLFLLCGSLSFALWVAPRFLIWSTGVAMFFGGRKACREGESLVAMRTRLTLEQYKEKFGLRRKLQFWKRRSVSKDPSADAITTSWLEKIEKMAERLVRRLLDDREMAHRFIADMQGELAPAALNAVENVQPTPESEDAQAVSSVSLCPSFYQDGCSAHELYHY